MKLPITVLQLNTKCSSCGAEIILNEHAAKYAHKGIMCAECRRGNVAGKWTKQSYADYLQTEHWRMRREMALSQAGSKCQVCAARDSLDVHHNDYSRLGGELMTDIVVLCHSCHTLFHEAQNGEI